MTARITSAICFLLTGGIFFLMGEWGLGSLFCVIALVFVIFGAGEQQKS